MEELFDVKDVFTSVNADDATAYVDKYVYLSNSLAGLRKEVEDNRFVTLDGILEDSNDKRFVYGSKEFSLCIPADKVKQSVALKKYRPFNSVTEFELATGLSIGDVIKRRYVGTEAYIPYVTTYMYIGCGRDTDGRDYVILGGLKLYVDELIDYEYLGGDGWRRLGVAEDER